jgi:glycosyltransferase involved in cell wall biosynthesis
MLLLVTMCCLRIWLTNLGRLSQVVIISQTTDLLVPAVLLKKLTFATRGPLVVTWAHDISMRSRYIWVYRRSDVIVGTNTAITRDLTAKLGLDPERLTISLNPISEAQLARRTTREAARRELGLAVAAPLVVYTGKLFIGQREAEYILEAARRLPGYRFLLTGGMDHVVRHYREFCQREGIDNVTFVGFLREYTEVSLYQAAADVLVSYYTNAEHLTHYQLPNKTCEYMLAGSPIVTCDFPATRDVLNADNAIFVEPENPEALAAGIRRAVEDPQLARRVAARALEDVRSMTYRQRAAGLVAFFRRRIEGG